MCSIPGLPMPQSEASIVIARVNPKPMCDLVLLWVSMEGGHKHSYEKMREEIQTPERKFCGSEGKPEDLCVVCISDTWHRARIVSVQDEICSVFLIDQGKLHDTTSEDLAWAQKESFILPPEVEFCILANVLSVSNSWSEIATEFFSSLSGKNFTGVVEHVLMPDRIILLDLPVVSAHLLRLEVTETVPAEEFKCLVLKSLHSLKEDTSEELGLTQEHKLNLNGQLENLDQTICLAQLNGDSQTVVNNDGLLVGTFPDPVDPVVGDRIEDKSTSDMDNKGTSKQLDPLVDDGENLSTTFIPERQNVPDDDVLTVGSSVSVQVNHVESPQTFRSQTTDNEDSLGRLPQDLQKHYTSFPPPPLVESIFIARNPDDNMWHRVKIVADSHSPVVDVKFLDCSHTQKIPLQDIHQYDCVNTDINGLTQNCSLKEQANNAVDRSETPPQDTQTEGKIPQTVSKRNLNTSLNKDETVTVYGSCISEPHFFWCQYSDTEDLNTVLELAQEAGQKQPDRRFCESLGPGSPCLALFSSDNRWYRARVTQRVQDVFRVVFIDYGNEAEVEKENVRALTQSLMDIPPQALLCSLSGFKKSEGSWADEAYDDFYNLLVDKPLQLTMLSMENHPENSVPQYFVELSCEGSLVNTAMQKYWKPATQKCVSKEKPPTGDSLQGGQTEAKMTQNCLSEENGIVRMYTQPKISRNLTETVYASCIAEPHYFWCQHTNMEDLNEALELAQEAAQAQRDTRFPATLGPGSPCLAPFSSDNRWYRAQVTQRVEDVFHVVFIDYGNELDVDVYSVRSVPQRLLEIAPQAFLCSLNGFEKSKGSWADEGYDDFYSLLVDKPLRLTVVSMERHSEASVPQYAVDVQCEGVAVNTLMQKYWKELDVEEASVENLKSEDTDETKTVEANV